MAEMHQDMLRRTEALFESSDGLRMVFPQDTGLFTLDQKRTQGVLELLESACTLLHEVTAACEGDDFWQRRGHELSPQEVADVAFLGRSELLDMQKTLQQAVAEGNVWKIAAQADRSVARTVRALVPIESALRAHEELEPLKRPWSDLDDALKIRGLYAELWIEAQTLGSPKGSALRDAFTQFTDRIALLRRDKIYPYLRIDDRLDIRALQKRVFAFMEGPGNEQDGQRLWQDMVGFFGLLMQTNRREELREHDRRNVARLCRDIFNFGDMPELIPPEMLQQVRHLATQDAELDELLLRPGPARSADYRDRLLKLRDRLLKP